jgi:hypothetical protein
MDKQYRHLGAEERAVMMVEHRKGVSLRAISTGRNRPRLCENSERSSDMCLVRRFETVRQTRTFSNRRTSLTFGQALSNRYCTFEFSHSLGHKPPFAGAFRLRAISSRLKKRLARPCPRSYGDDSSSSSLRRGPTKWPICR